MIEDCRPRAFPVGPDREVVLRLALARTVDGESREPPFEEQLLGVAELLLRGIETGYENHEGRRVGSARPAKHSDQTTRFEGDLHSLPGRVEVGESVCEATNRVVMCRSHLLEILHEDELGEVVVDGRLRQVRSRRSRPVLRECDAAEVLVLGGDRRPRGAPLLPAFYLFGYPLEIRGSDAVRGEARLPVNYRIRQPPIRAQ